MTGERFACVHGHFYQPPRENPWLGTVLRQPSAAPAHDWNSRVARECYVPNAWARVCDGSGKLADVVNNFAHMSFDAGPTLLSWMEEHEPAAYRRILEADRESTRRLGGHGNAIAHPYVHAILPLASPRDQATLVRWGLADFRRRFRRRPEAMWLPETGANDAVLGLLAEHGMSYVILAPSQAARVRPIGETSWKEAAGHLDPRRPHLWRDPRGRGRPLAVFFYHQALSHAVAFERLMADSAAASERWALAFHGAGGPALVSAATDGESFGHHHSFAEMGLAHLLTRALPGRGIAPVNPGFFLAANPPAWEVELKAGAQGLGTAWSCAHGLGRWLEDCGCGGDGKGRQAWRRPLREALDWVRDALADYYEDAGGRVLKDPWEARDAYGEVIGRGGEGMDSAAWRSRIRGAATASSRAKALRLLEMQRECLYMVTSCGWFFADIAGIEAAQNLRHAARAISIAREEGGPDLEADFIGRLKAAGANDRRYGDGAGVYEKLVRPSIFTPDKMAALYAMERLVRREAPQRFFNVAARGEGRTRREKGAAVFSGSFRFSCPATGGFWDRRVLSFCRPDGTMAALVCRGGGAAWDMLRARVESSSTEAGALAIASAASQDLRVLSFWAEDFPSELAAELLRRLALPEGEPQDAAGAALELGEKLAARAADVPASLRARFADAFSQALEAAACDGQADGLRKVRDLARRSRALKWPAAAEHASAAWNRLIDDRLDAAESRGTAQVFAALQEVLEAAGDLHLKDWKPHAEARVFDILRRLEGPPVAAAPVARLLGLPITVAAP